MEKVESGESGLWNLLLDGLWADGLRLFFVHWRSWIGGAFAFFVLLLCWDFLAERFPFPSLSGVVDLLIVAGELCFFSACLLKEEPLSGAPSPRGPSFWRSFGYSALLVVSAGLIHPLFSYGREALQTLFSATAFPVEILFAGAFVLEAMGFWAIVRFLLVPALVVSERDEPLRLSWALTEGKVLRFLINLLVLELMLFPCFVGVVFVDLRAVDLLFQVIVSVLLSAFFCAVCRKYNGEHIVATLGHDRRAKARSA